MPALPADIATAIRASSVATWNNGAIAARYPSARDGTVQPAEGFFDRIADARAVAAERGALIGTERRRFSVTVDDLLWPDLSAGVPRFALIDDEQAAVVQTFAARIELDLDAGTTSLELFG